MTNVRILGLGFALVCSACSSTNVKPSASSSPRDFQLAVNRPAAAREAEPAVLSISKDIREACGLDDSRAFFAYNSASVTSQDRAFFGKLAACFESGPLKGRGMHVVGHADPRGDTDYNYVLGQRRADTVKGAIVGAGLTGSRISTTSRGELEAEGQDESGWSQDRRVDIVLDEST